MTAPIDALAEELAKVGINAVPIFVASLKDRDSEALLNDVFAALPPAIVLNTTAFAVSTIGTAHGGTVLDRPGRPVLQVGFWPEPAKKTGVKVCAACRRVTSP